MFRKHTANVLVALLILALAFTGLQVSPVRADSDSDFPVLIEIIGRIQAVNVRQIMLTDGTVVLFAPETISTAPGLKVGMFVVIVAEVNGNDLIARMIRLATATEVAVLQAVTPTPTPIPTVTPTATPDSGKGKGKGNDKKNDRDIDRDISECLKNTTHPVAARLATALSVPYVEVMTWHCRGYGFGEVTRAYLIARTGKMTVQQVLEAKKGGRGWGAILKQIGLSPSNFAPGQVINKGK